MNFFLREQEKGCLAEIATAFYINIYVMLRPLIVSYSYRWTELLPLIVFFLFFVSFAHRGIDLKGILLKNWLAFCGFVTGLFLVDCLLRFNEFTLENYYSFVIHGLITGFLLINVKRYDQLLKYWAVFAIIAGVLYVPDPFNDYTISGGYMDFGKGMLPAFIASVIIFSYYRFRWILPLMVLFFIETVIYANKGATVSAITIIVFFILFNTEERRKKIQRLVILLIVAFFVLLMFNNILEMFTVVSSKLDVGSYSLTDFGKISQMREMSSFGSRMRIWSQVSEEFTSHYLFGMGIGGFESKYNNYAHNFFLDLFITHGVIIGGLILCVLFRFIRNTMLFFKINKDLFLFSFVMLLLWIFPSQVSFTYWKMEAFWVFMFVNMYNNAGKMIRFVYVRDIENKIVENKC